MASVHKLPHKPNWIAFYYDRNGKRRCKSTLTTNRREAERICARIQELEDRARTGRLTEDRARKVIETTVAEIMESIGAPVERKTVRQHFDSWLKAFEAERSSGTFVRYKGIADQFLGFLGARASASLAALGSDDVEKYRDYLLDRVAPRTVNTHLKVVRVALEKAVKQGVFDRNPARLVDNVNTSDRHERRAFTVSELQKLLAVVSEDWKTAILFGIYTGLRLGDVQSLTWANLDLNTSEVTIRTQKTNRVQILPLAKPLRRHIETLPAGDDPRQSLYPSLADRPVNSLSNEFFELLATAGLAQSRKNHRKQKQGRGARRNLSEISFHSLRHTATSLLKNAGVNDVVARDIIGHESEAVSRNYTHIDAETKRKAIDAMPDVLALKLEPKPTESNERPPAPQQPPPVSGSGS